MVVDFQYGGNGQAVFLTSHSPVGGGGGGGGGGAGYEWL